MSSAETAGGDRRPLAVRLMASFVHRKAEKLRDVDDAAMAHMRFPTDRHLTHVGHRWTATGLLDVLQRSVLNEDSS